MFLIIGGDSVIGKALAEYCRKENIYFHATTRDLSKVSSSRPFFDLFETEKIDFNNYEAAVICIGMSHLNYCENNPYETRQINVILTKKLVNKLNSLGIYTVILSTNQVFNGDKPFREINEKRCPINEYGRQKSELESSVENLRICGILRITKVISRNLPLLRKWEKNLDEGQKIKAFDDMSFCPVHLSQVVQEIRIIMDKKEWGIYHCSGEKDISYFEYAKDFAMSNDYDVNLVTRDSYKVNKGINYMVPKFTSLKV